ncbi:RNA polymerase subunit sigma-70 [Cohnella sp. CIP 111063]|uniref:sigma-70 family RNA polymerase sigma factor n=1 Tax=unclassified Cohnella TaxID=2636738 RepID=UPI000B8C203E|nr:MULTISPECIES: sigma-70 family RNA polymerase sigma factor [unclassified Cohnella]OXS57376.1 RNA polymerase subunit sigma-70 [Cohnella sp. CIP 111063]PRX70821.1 RNA polymerase sigma (SigV) subunit [Cohnella sp. SGD-V74]
MEETELARKAIAGDENSFTILIQSKRERLYRMAYTYVRNREDALEVVQETVYRAFLAIHKLQQPQYFNTWLTKIAINSALDFIRKSKKVVYAEPGAEGSYAPNHNEEALDLREALDSLDEKSRTAIMLRYFEDMQLKDIADVLDTPLSSVKSIIYRGLERLKIKLGESESIG